MMMMSGANLLSDVHIVYVNCDEARDRDQRMRAQFDKAGLSSSTQRMACCTPAELSAEDRSAANANGLQYVEVAIANSHIAAISSFVSACRQHEGNPSFSTKKYLLVMEDDITLGDGFVQKVSFLLDLVARGADRFAALYLSDGNYTCGDYSRDREAEFLIQHGDENVVVYRILAPHCAGMAAYIFSLEYCRHLLQVIIPNNVIRDPIDLYIQYIQFENSAKVGAHYTLRPHFLPSGHAGNWVTATPIPTRTQSSRIRNSVKSASSSSSTNAAYHTIKRIFMFLKSARLPDSLFNDYTRNMFFHFLRHGL